MSVMAVQLIPALMVTLVSGQTELNFDEGASCNETVLNGTCNSGDAPASIILLSIENNPELVFLNTNDIGTTKNFAHADINFTLEARPETNSGGLSASISIGAGHNGTTITCFTGHPRDETNEFNTNSFNITRSGTPNTPENLSFNGTTLSWNRPDYTDYTGGVGFSHYLITCHGQSLSQTGESLTRDRSDPLYGNVSVYSVNECGQVSAPATQFLSVLPVFQNPTVLLHCDQPLESRQVSIQWDADDSGVVIPPRWQASHNFICNITAAECTGRLTEPAQVMISIMNAFESADYPIDIDANALSLVTENEQHSVRLNPNCKPQKYRVALNNCANDQLYEDSPLMPGQSVPVPFERCVEASLYLADNSTAALENRQFELPEPATHATKASATKASGALLLILLTQWSLFL